MYYSTGPMHGTPNQVIWAQRIRSNMLAEATHQMIEENDAQIADPGMEGSPSDDAFEDLLQEVEDAAMSVSSARWWLHNRWSSSMAVIIQALKMHRNPEVDNFDFDF